MVPTRNAHNSEICVAPRARVAYVHELPHRTQPGYYSAEFAAHAESEGGNEYVEGPDSETLAAAVQWARTQAPIVIVTVGETEYSAGADHPDSTMPRLPSSAAAIGPRPASSAWRCQVWVSVPATAHGYVTEVQEAIRGVNVLSDIVVKRVASGTIRIDLTISGEHRNYVLAAESAIVEALARAGIVGQIVRTSSTSTMED